MRPFVARLQTPTRTLDASVSNAASIAMASQLILMAADVQYNIAPALSGSDAQMSHVVRTLQRLQPRHYEVIARNCRVAPECLPLLMQEMAAEVTRHCAPHPRGLAGLNDGQLYDLATAMNNALTDAGIWKPMMLQGTDVHMGMLMGYLQAQRHMASTPGLAR